MKRGLLGLIAVVIVLGGVVGFWFVMKRTDDTKMQTTTPTPATRQTDGTTKPPASPAGETPTDVAQVFVKISNMAFVGPTVTIKKGSTVTWTNNDSVGHTVTSDEGSELNSDTLAKGETYDHTFNTVGTFKYHCTPHPNMKATVIVTE